MHFSQLGVAATLAALTQAFLLPPTISSADKDVVNSLPFDAAAAANGRVLEIECPGCPVEITNIQGETKAAASEVESALRLNFSLSHKDADALMLNGLQIYPIDPRSQNLLVPLTADQLVKSSSGTWDYAAHPNLGYSFSVVHPVHASDDDQLDIVTLHLEINEVSNTFIDGIPSVDIKLLETPSGKLMIGDATVSPARPSASVPAKAGEECRTVLCKWRAIVADRLSKLKGCAGRMRPHQGQTMKPAADHDNSHHHHGHSRPRPYETHRAHHHHRHNGFAQFIRAIILRVFIPVMIGVVVGVTASAVGMVVGHIAIFTWRALFRRGQSPAYSRVQEEEAASEDEGHDETKSFLQHQDAPPVYEEAVAGEKASE
jgi:hypothetical protein